MEIGPLQVKLNFQLHENDLYLCTLTGSCISLTTAAAAKSLVPSQILPTLHYKVQNQASSPRSRRQLTGPPTCLVQAL